jgi:hypothetical protein
VEINYEQVFGSPDRRPYLNITDWQSPILYFVGRNGSGKSRSARAIATQLSSKYLSTDRLVGLMAFDSYQWGSRQRDFRGLPLGDTERTQYRAWGRIEGSANDEVWRLQDEPDVALRVAAFVQRALGRKIELRESSGFLDPYITVNDVDYSLFRDEGHGLRELVILLAAIYADDWDLLVIDEPELHLHPSMARLWLAEANDVCTRTGRRIVLVTHEPSLLNPITTADLSAIFFFSPGKQPKNIGALIEPGTEPRVSASLKSNPALVAQLVFAPRPVLVEGSHDVAALTTALKRTHASTVVAQTDFAECGGNGPVALWFHLCTKLGIDARAVADLDSCFDSEVQRWMDSIPAIEDRYRNEAAIEPPKTHVLLRPIIDDANRAGATKDPRGRAQWMAALSGNSGLVAARDRLLEIWKSSGLWLHPQGTLEQVLGLGVKGAKEAAAAAEMPGPIDIVADWCAYDLDSRATLEALLNVAAERIAHGVMEALRSDPERAFTRPPGSTGESDAKLVQIDPLGEGKYRLTVVRPPEFAGYWFEFSRDSSPNSLNLNPPPT